MKMFVVFYLRVMDGKIRSGEKHLWGATKDENISAIAPRKNS